MKCLKKLYIIPEAEQIEESLSLAKQYDAGFEYNDFFLPDLLDDKERMEEKIRFYKQLGRSCREDTLHGAFLDVTVHSDDRKIREISCLRVRQCMEIAKRLGIRGAVFHTNFIPNFRNVSYRENWVSRNESFWRMILQEYPEQCVFMENMFDGEPELLARLADRMKGQERFGVCLDYAHAAISGSPLSQWMEQLAPYICHMHINDNDLKEDAHKSIGDGQIDWQEFASFITYNHIESSVLVEVKGTGSQKKSIQYLKEKEIYPFGSMEA